MSDSKPVLSDYIDLGETAADRSRLSDLEVINDDSRSCPDCGKSLWRYYGPVDFSGQKAENGDFVCRQCAEDRGVVVTG